MMSSSCTANILVSSERISMPTRSSSAMLKLTLPAVANDRLIERPFALAISSIGSKVSVSAKRNRQPTFAMSFPRVPPEDG